MQNLTYGNFKLLFSWESCGWLIACFQRILLCTIGRPCMVLVVYKLVLWYWCQHLCVPTPIQDDSVLLLSSLKVWMLNPDFILNLKLFNSFSSRRLVCKPLVLCITCGMLGTTVMFCHYPSAFPDLSDYQVDCCIKRTRAKDAIHHKD